MPEPKARIRRRPVWLSRSPSPAPILHPPPNRLEDVSRKRKPAKERYLGPNIPACLQTGRSPTPPRPAAFPALAISAPTVQQALPLWLRRARSHCVRAPQPTAFRESCGTSSPILPAGSDRSAFNPRIAARAATGAQEGLATPFISPVAPWTFGSRRESAASWRICAHAPKSGGSRSTETASSISTTGNAVHGNLRNERDGSALSRLLSIELDGTVKI